MNSVNEMPLEKEGRLGCIDLVRFVMIILIMAIHLYALDFSRDYPWASCRAWVDYFFLLTVFYYAPFYHTQRGIFSGSIFHTLYNQEIQKIFSLCIDCYCHTIFYGGGTII